MTKNICPLFEKDYKAQICANDDDENSGDTYLRYEAKIREFDDSNVLWHQITIFAGGYWISKTMNRTTQIQNHHKITKNSIENYLKSLTLHIFSVVQEYIADSKNDQFI